MDRTWAKPARGLSGWRALSSLILLLASFASVGPDDAAEARPRQRSVPTVSLSVPAQVPVGQDVSFTLAFDNNDPVDVGYGPLLDVILDTTGADGDDGLGTTSISASYLTIPFTTGGPNPTMWVLTFDALGQATHPLYRDASGAHITVSGTPGDTLVVLRLPFGSFAPEQPPAVVNMTVNMSSYADVGVPLNVQARGGYEFGYTPLDDWCCGDAAWPGAVSGWTSGSVTPTLFALSKAYSGPEGEAATGPNFRSFYPMRYTVTVDIAPGQSIANLTLNDALPANLQYYDVIASSPAGASCTEPVQPPPPPESPGGILICSWAVPVSNSASLTFDFYVPRDDSSGSRVLNPITGNDATSCDDASVSGSWMPTDPRDQTGGPFAVSANPPGCEHTLTDKSVAIQKGVTNLSDPVNSPGDVLEYTLRFQISDFFALNAIEVVDGVSDGQHLDPTFTPTLQLEGNPYTWPVTPFLSTPLTDPVNWTYDVDCNYSGGAGAECTTDSTGAPNDGSTTLTFRVSGEIVQRALDASGRMVGGCVNPATGSANPDCGSYNNGPTYWIIRFRTVILDNFTDIHLIPPNSGDASIDQGDVLQNGADVTGSVLATGTFMPTGSSESDDSAADASIGTGGLSKSIYALNGAAPGDPVRVRPGDLVTYRITYVMPTGDEENLRFDDYLPLPVFSVDDPNNDGVGGDVWVFNPAISSGVADVPAAGRAMFGPSDDFYAYTVAVLGAPGRIPTITPNPTNNRVRFTYGDFDGPTEQQYTVDILFSVVVSDDPFADRLYLTNQAHAYEGSTNAGEVASDAIRQIILTEPVLVSNKAVVWTDNPSTVFSLPIAAPVVFQGPGSSPRWTGTINSNYLDATPIDSNVSFVDAGDVVTFAILVENTGSSLRGAFDIVLRDDLPAQFEIPSTAPGLNLQVHYGDRSGPIGYTGLGGGPDGLPNTADDLFGNGIELIDPVGQGVCSAHDPNLGNNIILVTFDLQLRDTVTPGTIVNTESLVHYAGSEGGPNHLPEPQTDTVETTVLGATAKALVSTGIVNANNGNTQVVIGELATYRLTITVPEGQTPGAQLVDTLDSGLAFVEVLSVTTSAAVTHNPISIGTNPTNVSIGASGRLVTYSFGTITNANRDNGTAETIEVVYRAVALNVVGNQSGTALNNEAVLSWTGASLSPAASPAVTIIEPVIAVDKLVSVNGSVPGTTAAGDADDTVDYTVTLRHDPSSAADAFDVELEDILPRQTPGGPSYLVGPIVWSVVDTAGQVTAANFQLAGSDAAGYTLSTVTPFEMTLTPPAGPSPRVVTVTISGRLSFLVQPGPLPNTATGQWTSLSGAPGQRSIHNAASTERTGADGPGAGLNNYADTGVATINILAAPTKSIVATSETHTGFDGARERLAIGEIVRYRMSVGFPEGTSPNFQLVDQLPQGLLLIDNAQVRVSFTADNGVTEPVDMSGADNDAVPPTFVLPASRIATVIAGNRQTVTFTLGDLVNNDSDAGAETITLEFNALVENSAVGSNDAGDDRNNNFTVWVAGVQVGSASNNANARISEPSMTTLTKTILTPAFDGGDTATYRLSFANASGANVTTAFDVLVTETVPAHTTFAGPSGPGAWSCALGAPAGTVCSYAAGDLAPGASGQVDFSVTVVNNVPIGIIIPNSAVVTYTSLPGTNGTPGNPTGSTTPGIPGASDGERDGSGVPALNDYRATGTVDLSLRDPALSKTIFATSVASTASGEFDISIVDLVIGEEITFEVTATLPEGTAVPLTLTDNLPTVPGGVLRAVNAGIVSIGSQISTSIVPTITLSDGPDPDALDDQVVFDLGNATNTPDGVENDADRIIVRVAARVENVAENQNADRLTNTAALAYNAETVNATGDVEIVEPVLTITKLANDDSPALGQTVTYTLTVSHLPASTADAQDVVVTDVVPVGLTYVAGSASAPAGWTADDTAAPTLVFRGALTQAAGSVSFIYQATLGVPPAVVVGQTFTNTANATWTSISGPDANERTGTGVGPNDYATSAAETATASEIDLTLTKDDGGITAAPDQTYAYTLTIGNIGNVDATGVTVTDTVPLYTTLNPGGSSPGWSCVPDNSAGSTCTIHVGSLAAGGSVDLTFSVTVDGALPVLVTQTSNSARVDGLNEPVLLQGNNADTDSTPLDAAPDLVITKDDSLSIISPAQVLTYVLTYTNAGDQNASGVAISENVPAGTTFSGPSGPGAWSCPAGSAARTLCTFAIGNLAVGAGGTVNFVVVVNDPPGVAVVNTASIADDGANGPDGNPADNSATDTDNLVTLPDADLTKVLDSTNQTHTSGLDAAVGEILTYEVVMTIPPGSMPSAELTDVLDRGLAFVDCLSLTPSVGLTTDRPGGFAAACSTPTVAEEPAGSGAAEDQGRRVTFDLGSITSPGPGDATLTLRYRAVVLDNADNGRGDPLANRARWTWTGGDLEESAAPVTLVEPTLTLTKTASPTVAPPGAPITFTLTLGQAPSSDSDAFDLVLADVLPPGLTYVGGLAHTAGMAPTTLGEAAGTITATWDTFPLGSSSTIEFQVALDPLPAGTSVRNEVSLEWTSLPDDTVSLPFSLSPYNALSTERRYDPATPADVYQVVASATVSVPALPATGFAPGRRTELPAPTAAPWYETLSGVRLIIPALDVDVPVVGVPTGEQGWDLTWLWDRAGYLHGTAYPTVPGNSALTAHVYLPDGRPGPFVHLADLGWDDEIVVVVNGLEHVYRVRQVLRVRPDDLSVLRHEDYSWVTLITCQGYDEARDQYRWRVAVRAVLVAVRQP